MIVGPTTAEDATVSEIGTARPRTARWEERTPRSATGIIC